MRDFIYIKDIKKTANLYFSIVFVCAYILSGLIYYFGGWVHYLPISCGLLGVFVLRAIMNWFSND
jgi:hypothetical protein